MFAALTTNQFSRQLKGVLSNEKTVRLSHIAAAGAFIGSIIGYQLGGGAASGLLFGVLKVSAWDACIGIGTGASIAWVQS